MGCQNKKMQTLEHFWAAKIRKCKHYSTFAGFMSELNNTRALLGCQDEKMQTLQHFFGVWLVAAARFLEEGLLII